MITVYEVAAFSMHPNGGSPTGVVLDADNLSHSQMLHIARSVPFSHTAFVTELDHAMIGIRFFTHSGEIKNCGHATVAAHFLRVKQGHDERFVQQQTLSGRQAVKIQLQDEKITVYLKQNPITITEVAPDIVTELLSILNLSSTAFPVISASPGTNRFLVGVASVDTLNALNPNIPALKALCDRLNHLGCFVYAFDGAKEVVARMFAPSIGVDEDVINGNSSGCLGTYLQRDLNVHQGHRFNRVGVVRVSLSLGETYIGGEAVLVSQRLIDIGL